MKYTKLLGISLIYAIYCIQPTIAATGTIASTASGSTTSLYDKIATRSEFMQKLKEKDQKTLLELYNKGTSLDEIDLGQTQAEIEDINTQLQNISSEFNQLSDQRQDINAKYNEIKETMRQVVEQSQTTKATIDDRIGKIRLYTKSFIELQKETEQVKNEIEDVKALLVRFATVLYRLNNEYYDKNMEIDQVKLLVKSENIANTLSSEELIKILTFRFDQLIALMQDKQTELTKRQETVDSFRVKYRDEISQLRDEVELLNQQRTYLLEFLNLYRQDKLKLNGELGILAEDKEELLQTLRQKMQESYQGSSNPTTTKQLNQLVDHKDIEGPNYLSRPVLPIYQIIGSYNDEHYRDYYGPDNLGIDISAAQFTPVYSPGPGIVHQVQNRDGISLNWIIITHPGGYTSLITSLNKIIVKEGETVHRGQLIGSSGGEPGTRGAGFASPGPKVHFEVYKNGKSINPLSVLDLSVIQNRNAVPIEFEIKYLTDRASRQIDLSDVKIMPGTTLNERRAQYLNQYGYGEFARLALWQDAAAEQAIDIDLGICIATAESSMGRNLSSAWNVGNVGNNDRGDRIDLGSALEGASLIFYALNNEYLGRRHTIYKLSGYGNKVGPIYASSEINWQRNVMKCLTSIKGYRVPEEYPFRLMK